MLNGENRDAGSRPGVVGWDWVLPVERSRAALDRELVVEAEEGKLFMLRLKLGGILNRCCCCCIGRDDCSEDCRELWSEVWSEDCIGWDSGCGWCIVGVEGRDE